MRVSVLIPVYNAANYLPRCLDSIIAQTYADWEVIAVDDGSRDDSYQILCKYAEKDARIRAFTKENEGPGLTRNYALDQAQGDYIVFVDSDDYIEPDYFEKVAQRVQEENADVVFIDAVQERPDGSMICEERMSSFFKYSKRDLLSYQMCGTMPWGGWRKAARRKLIEDHEIRYTRDPVGEEAAYSFKLLHYADVISFVPSVMYHYINYPTSQSKAGGEDPWGPVAKHMRGVLDGAGVLEDYEAVLNGFAYSGLIVWLLRYAAGHTLGETMKAFKERRKAFADEYGWNIATQYLRKEARMLLPMVQHNVLFPVAVAAKLRGH